MIYIVLDKQKAFKTILSSPLHLNLKKKFKDFNTVRTLLKGICKKNIDLVAGDWNTSEFVFKTRLFQTLHARLPHLLN